MIDTRILEIQTTTEFDAIDLTSQVRDAVQESAIDSGTVTIFFPGTTGAVTTLDFESGVIADLRVLLEEFVPREREYQHQRRWKEDHGSAQLRATILGPSLTIPFISKMLALGAWQQIVFIEFDIRPRTSKIIVQIMGE